MNNGGEAADQMVREALQVTEVAIKLSALGIKTHWPYRWPTPRKILK